MKRLTLALLPLALAASPVSYATDPDNGKALHDDNCMHCHNTSVFSRKNHMVKSLPALKKQVYRCQLSQDLQWFDEEIEDVTAYLNKEFYKFPE